MTAIGIGFRPELASHVRAIGSDIDILEVIAEGLFDLTELPAPLGSTPIALHAVGLSLGSDEPLDQRHLRRLAALVDLVRPRWVSDHLAVTRTSGVEIGHLAPMAWSAPAIARTVAKIRTVCATLGVPFLVENIAYYFRLPTSDLAEHDALAAIVADADCGLLLDVNNLHVNSVNTGYEPYEFIERLPLERVVEIHLAGSAYHGDVLVDTHGHPVRDEVFEYLRAVCARTEVAAVIVERDQNPPTIDELHGELRRAREIVTAAARERG